MEGDEVPERLFLLGRIGFLITLERGDAVKVMVEREEVIKSLVSVSDTSPLLYDKICIVGARRADQANVGFGAASDHSLPDSVQLHGPH